MKLSIISPVYNAESSINELVMRILRSIPAEFDALEIILVDDGSPDNCWGIIEELSNAHSEVIGLRLSRNFGQHQAITAGLEHSTGDWVVVMDCDLQDQPEEIGRLFTITHTGYDVVLAQRSNRKDSILKRVTADIFYRLFSYLTDTRIDRSVGNFGIYSRLVIDAIIRMGDYQRIFTIMVQWVGFNRAYLPVEHAKRVHGKSSYTWSKLFRLAFDIIISFSEKPLRIGLKIGVTVSIFSFLLGLFYLLKYFFGYIEVPGYSSIMVMLSFATGIIITFIGLVGVYVAKIQTQVKGRPIYLIKARTVKRTL